MFLKTICLSLVLLAVVDQSEGGPVSQLSVVAVRNRAKEEPKTCAEERGKCRKKVEC